MQLSPSFFDMHEGGAVCRLCFRSCRIARGSFGVCRARGVADDGSFISPQLGRFASVAIDPIEKKPLRRWRPGTAVLSLGGLHCNADCPFCQNHEIAHPSRPIRTEAISPEALADAAVRARVPSVAFTYNEPTLQAEYMLAASPLLHERGIDVVLVTNGLFSAEAADAFSRSVDAMNIDVKTFSAEIYRSLGGDLAAVTSNVELLCSRGVHVEITTLVVPGISDDASQFADLVSWASDISRDLPLHITRYHPARSFTAPHTEIETMERAERIARAKLAHVYLGNV